MVQEVRGFDMWLGIVGTIIMSTSGLIQLYSMRKNHNLSVSYAWMILVGLSFMLAYSAVIGNTIFVVCNGFGICQFLAILWIRSKKR